MGSAPGKFLAIARTDAKLEDLSVSGQFPAASEDAGMGKFDTEIIIPQIGVSVKVDDVDVREFFKTARKAPRVTRCSPPSMNGRLWECRMRLV